MSAPGNIRAAEDTRSDWETPADLFTKLDAEFGFTLDAAANETNRKCERWLEGPCDPRIVPAGDVNWLICQCGICSDWMDHTVWLNPPYGREIGVWVMKCLASARAGATVMALLPANPDTVWFRTVWDSAHEVRFLSKRVQFVGTTSSNPGGSMVAIWRRPQGGMLRNGPLVTLWDWSREVPA